MKRGRTGSVKRLNKAASLSKNVRIPRGHASPAPGKVNRSRPPAFPEIRLRIEVWSDDPEVRVGHFEIPYRIGSLCHAELVTLIAEPLFDLVSKKIPKDHFHSKSKPEDLDWKNPNYKASDDDIPF